jgi:hypothetical protein
MLKHPARAEELLASITNKAGHDKARQAIAGAVAAIYRRKNND